MSWNNYLSLIIFRLHLLLQDVARWREISRMCSRCIAFLFCPGGFWRLQELLGSLQLAVGVWTWREVSFRVEAKSRRECLRKK